MGLKGLKIVLRGAGEMASGVGVRLHRSGFRVVFTEIAAPLCVRRLASFSPALDRGWAEVEGCMAVKAETAGEAVDAWAAGRMAVLVDPDLTCLPALAPEVLVDAALAKHNLGLRKGMAELVVALGPGFTAGVDADVVIETNRGHNLGRLIHEGRADANTGSPGEIQGETLRRVLRAPADGLVETDLDVCSMVKEGQTVMTVGGKPVKSELNGILRGLIKPGVMVWAGLKVGDVDPRGDPSYCRTISDKARAIGGSVLEAILHHFNR
jgi:xanthine dehydrogenase accessory factor